jgi:hypothetical protein
MLRLSLPTSHVLVLPLLQFAARNINSRRQVDYCGRCSTSPRCIVLLEHREHLRIAEGIPSASHDRQQLGIGVQALQDRVKLSGDLGLEVGLSHLPLTSA